MLPTNTSPLKGYAFRARRMKREGSNYYDIFICAEDLDQFLNSKHLQRIEHDKGDLAPWETMQDETTQLLYYNLTVIPYLVPMQQQTAKVRDALIRLMRNIINAIEPNTL